MGNPFDLQFNPFQSTSAISNTQIGGSKIGGGYTPQAQGVQGFPSQGGVSEVGQIGANKKADFMNGLGGYGGPQTNMNGDEIGHRLRLVG